MIDCERKKKENPTKVGNITHKSGFTKKQLDLMKIFVKEPWRKFTITELKDATKSKSHHYIDDTTKKFVACSVLKEDKKGKTKIYNVDFKTDNAISFLAFVEHVIKDERGDIPIKKLNNRIISKIKTPFYSFLIGGSYAEKKQKPTSDIDVAIIIPDNEPTKKSFEIALKEGELMMPEVHGFVFTREEFYLMLTNDEFNYGKELARKHIIVYGAEAYYKILFEAMRHGFNG